MYKRQAYEYAKNELLAANSIGDTEGNVGVTNTDNTFTINAVSYTHLYDFKP